jgi:hypothetical protein
VSVQQGDPEHPSRRLKSSADTKKCVGNALEEPVCNRFLVPAGRFNAPLRSVPEKSIRRGGPRRASPGSWCRPLRAAMTCQLSCVELREGYTIARNQSRPRLRPGDWAARQLLSCNHILSTVLLHSLGDPRAEQQLGAGFGDVLMGTLRPQDGLGEPVMANRSTAVPQHRPRGGAGVVGQDAQEAGWGHGVRLSPSITI